MQYAKVNLSSRDANHTFPEYDKLKVFDVSWEHQLNPKTALSSRAWVTDSNLLSSDIGDGFEFNSL